MMSIKMVTPRPFNRISRRTGVAHNHRFERAPRGNDTLTFLIKLNSFPHYHWGNKRPGGFLNLIHPAVIAVTTYTLDLEVNLLGSGPRSFRSVLRVRDVHGPSQPTWVPFQNLGGPFGKYMFLSRRTRAAEDANSGHWWYAFTSERQPVGSTQTEDPEGAGNPIPNRKDFMRDLKKAAKPSTRTRPPKK